VRDQPSDATQSSHPQGHFARRAIDLPNPWFCLLRPAQLRLRSPGGTPAPASRLANTAALPPGARGR